MKWIGPRTLREFREMERLAAYGLSDREVLRRMSEAHRHSELIFLDGRRYCGCCAQLISVNECLNCGQTLLERGVRYAF